MTTTYTHPDYITTMIRPDRIEFAKNWIADLRSGNFQQGSGKLHKHYGEQEQFCCLGVACKRIFDEKLIPGFTHKIDELQMYEVYGSFENLDTSASLLPEVAFQFMFGEPDNCADPRIFMNIEEFKKFQQSELGQTVVPDSSIGEDRPLHQYGYFRRELDGLRPEASYEFSLMSLNDGGVPFTVIADMIEKFMLPTDNNNN